MGNIFYFIYFLDKQKYLRILVMIMVIIIDIILKVGSVRLTDRALCFKLEIKYR